MRDKVGPERLAKIAHLRARNAFKCKLGEELSSRCCGARPGEHILIRTKDVKLVRWVATARRCRTVGGLSGALRAIWSHTLMKIASFGAKVAVRLDWISRTELPFFDVAWTIRSSSA